MYGHTCLCFHPLQQRMETCTLQGCHSALGILHALSAKAQSQLEQIAEKVEARAHFDGL